MTSEERLENSILEENERRWKKLRADYNPVTGEGLPGDRVWIHIPDFAVPRQYVPRTMLRNAFVAEILKCGSIAKFLKAHPDDPKINTPHHVEIELRKIRHQYDTVFWAYFCFPIISKEGGEIKFKLNYPQIELNEVVQKKQDAEEPIDVVVVKARQWGGSTYSIMKQTHILFKLDKYHSFVVAAHVKGASENIVRMLKYAVKNYPAWDLGLPENETLELSPVDSTGNAYGVKDSKGNQVLPGIIYIGSAQYPDSLRSPAVRGAHYSEVGVWPDTPQRRPSDLVASISGGILKRHLTMQVMESTAKSSDDFFHDVYSDAKKGQSSYAPLFIPWYHIPHDTIAIKNKRTFIKWLVEHKDDDTPNGRWKDPGKHYWWLWTLGATLEGINWYRYKRLDFTTYAQMANEAPSTDIEAFQAAGNKVFDFYQVEALRQFCRPPAMVGKLISNNRRGKDVLTGIRFVEQRTGNLMVYEEPDDTPVSNRYLVSVDIGGPNPTSDFHSVRVLDRLMMMPEFDGIPNIVAEMHYHCKRDDLVYDAVRLAKWYNNAKLIIESNTLETHDPNREVNGDGSQYVLDVAAEIYPNLYTREAPADQIDESHPATKYGFHTNPKTKPQLIDLLQWAIAERAWDEPNEMCIEELSMYIEDHNKFTAPPRKHDDILMSTAILLFVCYRETPLPHLIQKTKKRTTKPMGTVANI